MAFVAEERVAASWQPMFRAWLGQPAEVTAPLSEPELAALTANRAARADERTNICRRNIRRATRASSWTASWLRGLGSVLALYVAGC